MRILLGMPSVGQIPVKTVISLLQTVEKGKVDPMIVTGSLVYDSRDTIAKYAMENDYDYILFADSDMIFSAADVQQLLAHDTDIVSGLYTTRNGYNNNVVYSQVITRRRFPKREPRLIVDSADTGYGPVRACGLGFALVRVSAVKCMAKRFKSLFEPFKGVGEDIAFCIRAKQCGYTIYCDRDVKLGHIGETVYGGK